jgi:hypothetical protein
LAEPPAILARREPANQNAPELRLSLTHAPFISAKKDVIAALDAIVFDWQAKHCIFIITQ